MTSRERLQFGFDRGDLLFEGLRFFKIIVLLQHARELLAESLQIASQNVDSFFALLVHAILSWLRTVEWKDRPADLLERQRTQIARAGAKCVDRVAVFRDRVVGLPMSDRRLDTNDRE